jgi:hypothetical protein
LLIGEVSETVFAWCPVAGFGVRGAELSGSATCEVAQEIVVITKEGDAFSTGYGFYSAYRFFQSTQSVDGVSPILC